MAKIFGVNTKISGKVGQLLYRQTRTGTVVSELPVKPVIPRRSARQMDRRAQWANLGAIYKQFDAMLRKGYENLPPQMSVYNAFIQANIDVVKVYITKTIRLNGGAILAAGQDVVEAAESDVIAPAVTAEDPLAVFDYAATTRESKRACSPLVFRSSLLDEAVTELEELLADVAAFFFQKHLVSQILFVYLRTRLNT